MDVVIGVVLSLVGTALSAAKFYEAWISKRREVRPMLQIEFENYENKPLQISLINKGLGPLRIKRLIIETPDGQFAGFRKFIEHYNFKGIRWYEFSSDLAGNVLSVGDDPLVILKCDQKKGDIESLREKLTAATISAAYMDIFDRMMPLSVRKCDWFRNI